MKYANLPRQFMLAGALAAAGHAVAAGIDGTSNVMCATQSVVACTAGPTCLQGGSREFDVPDFVFIDVKKKEVRAEKFAGSGAVSPVRNVDKTENQVILQGVEAHRGWTLAIDRNDGSMTLTSVGADLDILIFGACTTI